MTFWFGKDKVVGIVLKKFRRKKSSFFEQFIFGKAIRTPN